MENFNMTNLKFFDELGIEIVYLRDDNRHFHNMKGRQHIIYCRNGVYHLKHWINTKSLKVVYDAKLMRHYLVSFRNQLHIINGSYCLVWNEKEKCAYFAHGVFCNHYKDAYIVVGSDVPLSLKSDGINASPKIIYEQNASEILLFKLKSAC